jgi:hypothetical protein
MRRTRERLVPAWVPADVGARVYVGELAMDRADIRRELQILEAALGHHVAAYAPDCMPLKRAGPARRTELCALFEPACLTRTQLAMITGAESKHPGILFVAYVRPLVMRDAP